ncbi:MAG: hypothetical protein AB7S68_38890 [Polyangiaceae bacterium]
MLTCGGCGAVGENPAAPGVPSPPKPATSTAAAAAAECPAWEPIEMGNVELGEDAELSIERGAMRIEESLADGELVRASAIANATWQACEAAKADVSQGTAQNLGSVLRKLREATAAPLPGSSYVTLAKALEGEGKRKEARAAWDRAFLSYLRETHAAAERVHLRETTPAQIQSEACMPEVHLEHPTHTSLRVRKIGDAGRYYWDLQRADGSKLFSGEARYVKAVTDDRWLVFRDAVDLMQSDGRMQHLGSVSCGARFRVVGDWLVGAAGGEAHALNLTHPERSFELPLPESTSLHAHRVGEHLEIWGLSDDGPRSLIIFSMDSPDPFTSAWKGEKLPQEGTLSLYDVARWGGVLVQRKTVSNSLQGLGFNYEFNAIELKTGKRLAQLLVPPSAATSPAATLDARYGLIVADAGTEVRVTALGSTTSRKLKTNEIFGQVTSVEVTPDGLLCTAEVQMGRYYSCTLSVTADLNGTGRQRTQNRFCLDGGDRPWSGVVTPRRGLEHLQSGGRSVMYGVCGQRLAPDGTRAAFIEVKPRRDDEPFTGALVLLIDTKTRRERWARPLPGETPNSYAFIDVQFSPDGSYVASLFGAQVSVFRTSDGSAVGESLPAPDLNGIFWLDSSTFSGGSSEPPVFSVASGKLRLQPPLSAASGHTQCLFGSLLTPAEVCRSLAEEKP